MKIKNIFTVLFVAFLLASCVPLTKAVSTFTPQSGLHPTETITSNWKTYISELFLVTLKYPAYWEINNEGYAVYSGQDGFFQISASSISGFTAKEMCENDIQINNSGKVNNYGTNPTMEILQVDNQSACLVLPSDDQPQSKRGVSFLVVEYPKLEDGHIRLLQFFADKNHIRGFISTLTFIR